MKIHSKHTSPLYRKSFRYSLLFLFLAIVFCNSSSAQSISLSDLKTVDVQSLSDEQIKSFMEQVESRGLSQSEVETLARTQGVSESQIAELRKRIQAIQASGNSSVGSTDMNDRSRSSGSGTNQNTFGLQVNKGVEKLNEVEKKIFGMGLFRRASISFSPDLNLPTPVDYELGPGDELIVDLWGTTQLFFNLEVSQEGIVRPKGVGPVYVNGLTVEKATERIIDRLSERYSGLKAKAGKNPTIFSQVSLGNIRTINIEILGSAQQPGAYALPSLATTYTALYAAGGPAVDGSFRNIRVIRNNKLFRTIDLYGFLTTGIKSGDFRLKNGDVIVIPPYNSRVEIMGEIKNPGFFELKDGESFQKLLDYSNGFRPSAYKDIVTARRKGIVEQEIFDVKSENFNDFIPKDGDLFEVSSILNRFSNRVVIKGAVERRGEYELSPGLTLKGLIEKAGGFRGDEFAQRITIYRVKEDFSQVLIPVDYQTLMDGSSEDIPLMREDIVSVSSIFDLGEEQFIQVTGEVQEGGVYPYFQGLTVQDLIVLAGGLKESASGASIEISRRNKNRRSTGVIADIISLDIDTDLSLSNDNRNLVLQPFDQVYIRASPNYSVQEQLSIEGEITSPGFYTISRKDERISDIIKRANGLTAYAYPKGAILMRKSRPGRNSNRSISDQGKLKELRNKILNGQSQMKNETRSTLLDRIAKLETRIEISNSTDIEGEQFKREQIQNISEIDSLIPKVVLETREAVAINLGLIMENPGGEYDLIVKPGDLISIPSGLETVRVTGHVVSTLNVKYHKKLTFKDYIERSGGYRFGAKKSHSYVQYPNGESHRVRTFLFFKKYPRIEPGSTIVIAEKPERTPVNFQAIVATAGSVATLALVIDRLSN